jgi:tetratricopeptide (TPR) repeat protein
MSSSDLGFSGICVTSRQILVVPSGNRVFPHDLADPCDRHAMVPRLAPDISGIEAHPHMVTLFELDFAQQRIDDGEPWAVHEHVADILTGERGDGEFLPIAYNLKALAFAHQGQYEDARSALAQGNLDAATQQAILDIAAEVDAHWWVRNAESEMEAGEYEAAANILANAAMKPGVNATDDFMRIHYDLGVVYARAGNAELAGEHLQAAGRFGDLQSLLAQPEEGTEGGDLVAQGDAALESGDAEAALRLYAESTVRLGTPVESMPAVHLRMAKAAAMMGNEDLAREHAAAANHYMGSIDELAQLPLPPLPGQ